MEEALVPSVISEPPLLGSLQRPEHLGEGVTQAAMYFGRTMKQGVQGVVMKPIQGAKKEGVVGVATGVGKGIAGLVVAPIAGETWLAT